MSAGLRTPSRQARTGAAPSVADRRRRRARRRWRTPGARARGALAVDLAAAAILALVALEVTAGLGVVAFIAIPILVVGLVWIGIERAVSRLRRRRLRRI